MMDLREWSLLTAYRTAVWAAQPLLHLKLARRGRQEPGYLHAVPERFGRYEAGLGFSDTRPLWVHAVSLGETRAASGLTDELRRRRPGLRLLLTHTTATGREAGRALLRAGDQQVWLPWDKPSAVARFLARFQPGAGVLVETEVWPEMVLRCGVAGVPLLLVSGRLSERSARAAARWPSLAGPAYRGLDQVWAQTEADAHRLRACGAAVNGVCGNLKFDVEPDAALLDRGRAWRAIAPRPVALLASARPGEEAGLLAALADHPARDALQWMVVPRHPQRFDEVARLIAAAGWRCSRRIDWDADGPSSQDPRTIWLGDSVGEMPMYYGLADVVLMGGTFGDFGGQNLIEAAACGCPLILGRSTDHFEEAAAQVLARGGALRVDSLGDAVGQALTWCLGDPCSLRRSARAAESFVAEHRGATGRVASAVLSAFDSSVAARGSIHLALGCGQPS